MSKAEDKAAKKALEKFPILFGERMGYDKTSLQQERRNAFEKGYRQAEKYNELTWEDVKEIYCIALNLREHVGSSVFGQPFYEEVLKRFKDFKERKEK